jgi:hypothetical protein
LGAAAIEKQMKQRRNNNDLSNDFAGLTVIELHDNDDHNGVTNDSTIDRSNSSSNNNIINDNTDTSSTKHGSTHNQDPLAVQFLLTAALWGRDEDFQPYWTSVETAALSTSLLTSLQQKLSFPVSSSSAAAAASSSSFDALISVVLEDIIQPVVNAYSFYNTRTSQLTRYKGPESRERIRAAHQLTWLTRHLGNNDSNNSNDALARHVPTILPLLLACLNDVSPEVQSAGLWGLEYCANNHLNNKDIISLLRPSRKVSVLDTVRQAVVGCDEVVWPAGAAALVALAIHVEGTTNPTSTVLVQVVDTMMYEAELHQTKPERALIWLHYFPKMFPTLSFLLVRYFSRLMPLLIGWISDRSYCSSGTGSTGTGNSGTAVQEAAIQCLTEALKWTWPRSNVHIPVVWPIIEKVYDSSDNSSGVVEAAKRCGIVMYAIADETFKEELKKGQLVNDVLQELASSRQMLLNYL